MSTSRIGILAAAVFGLFVPIFAHATLTVTPLTWNVVGLDSNNPASGPRFFPIGARVCSNVATTNVAVNWNWDSANPNVNLRTGSLSTINLPAIAAGACADAYFEIEVNQVPAAYDTTRRYHITATDGSGTASSPTPREVYVEHLISQNRNAITGVKLNGTPIPAGGSMNLVVGNTYTIELDGGTATQGYNQFEAFINFPNTIFQILSVSTTYSADNSPYVPGPAPIASDKLYADACLWQSDPTSPNYLSCVGGDYKAGGSSVVTTYTINVISGGGTAQTLNSLLYDFSGSSYHYNSDFGVNAIIANIIDPAALTISKAFSPSPAVAGGTSTLTFTISNPNPSPVSGASFSDSLPALSGSQMVVATPAIFSTSGCGAPSFAPAAGASSISFTNGSVAANSTCVVSVMVSMPSSPTSGTYTNTSNHLFVGGVDTGHFASASLGLTAGATGSGVCGQTLANWTVPNGTTANPPDLAGGVPTIKAANVSTATASANVPADTAIIASSGQNDTTSWQTFGYKSAGQYIEFVVDTRNYTGVQMSFYVANPSSGNGPTSIDLSYNNGSGLTSILTISNPATPFTQHTFDFTGLTSTSGSTTFRLTATGAKNDNSGAGLNYDNISFSGCGTPTQPTLSKAFATNPIAVNGTSTLTFTLSNPNSVQLTGAKFTDALPAGLQVAASPSASTTCTGSPTWAPSAGATSLTFGQPTGANVPASGSCTASVNVTATTAGPHTNVSGFISTTEGGTNSGASGSATASLSAIVAPTIAKSFGTNPILVNGTSLLTFTITNPNESDTLTGIAFADTYPGGLVNVSPLSPPVANTCAGSVTASAGGNTLSLSNGSLAAGASCTISVTVTSATAGVYVNTSGAVSATTAGTGNSASASLTVNPPHPAVSVLKQLGTSATGPWFKFLSVAPTTPLYYQFTAENTGDVALNPFSVSDPTLVGTGADPSGCVWQTTNSPSTLPALPVATATIEPTATCVVGPISAALGDHPNSATAHGTYSAAVYDSSPAGADYIGATPGFNLLKQIGTSASGPWSSAIGVAVGDGVFYKFTLVNTGGFALSSISVTDALVSTVSCTLTDPLPVGGATTCIVGPVVASGVAGSTTTNTATGHGSNGGTPVDTAPSSASYSIGSVVSDLAISKTDGVSSVTAGGSTSYTITVTNNGPAEVSNATVVDNAPANMTFGTWSCTVTNPGSGGSVTTACGAGSGSGNLNTTATMKNGAVITYSVPATIAPDATGSLTNTATAAVPGGVIDPTPGNNSATDTDTVNLVADLAITKGDGVASVTAGGSTIYTIVVSNNGPSSVTGAGVSDVLPAAIASATFTAVGSGGASGFSASGSGNINDTVTLPAGGTITYTVNANISSGATGTLVNTATVTAPAGVTDPNPASNTATDTDTLAAQVTLAVVKTDGSATYTPGGTAVYSVTISDTGASDANDVSVTDALPSGVTLTASVTCVANGNAACGTVTGSSGDTSFGATGAAVGAGIGNSLVFTAPVAFSPGLTTDPVVNTATASDLASGATASGSDSDTLAPQISLAVLKTDGSTTYTPGGTATYTVTISNGGVSDATNVTVSDALPSGVTLTANAGCVANGSASCGAVTGLTGETSFGATGAQIAAGAGNALVFTSAVAFAAGMATDPLVNTAIATDQLSGASGSGSDSDARSPQVSLAVTKTDNSATYQPGGAATYTVTVANTGLTNALDVSVDDTLPPGVTLTGNVTCTANGSATCGAVTGSAGQTSFSATGATIATGGGNSLQFTVPVAFASGLTDDPLVNSATANDLASGASGSDSDSDARASQAGLAITKTDGSPTYTPGGSATYTIVVTNAGPSDATSLTVSDPLPLGVTLTADATCTASGSASCGTVTGLAGQTSFGTTGASLAAGAGNSLAFTASVAFASSLASNPLTNTVTASDPSSASPVAASDSDTRSAVVDLAITKTDGATTAVPGQTVTYTMVVSNAGPSDAIAATVTDALPAALTGASWSCTASGGGSCAASGTGNISDTVNVPVGATLTYTVLATVSPGATGALVNTATLTPPAGATEANPANDSATDSDTLTGGALLADLSITKTDGVASVNAGGATIYTIVVSNPGPSMASGAVFTDPAVANLNVTGVSCGGVSGGASCPTAPNTTVALMQGAGIVIPTLPSGGSVTFTVNATIAALATGTIANTANIAVPTGVTDPDPANNSATDADSVAVGANLALSKSAASTAYAPGGNTTYSIIVTNGGPSLADNVTITDNLPSGVTLSATVTCIATGSATCGTISGIIGGTSFTATGATIGAGAGDQLVYSLPVHFAAGLKAPQITNTVTASSPSAANVASASHTSALKSSAPAQAIPVNDRGALWLLACIVLLLGGRLARSRR